MAGHAPQPLTPAEAKARLRLAAARATPTYWLRRHPWRLLLVALGSGFVAGRLDLEPTAAARVGRNLLPLMIRGMIARRALERRAGSGDP